MSCAPSPAGLPLPLLGDVLDDDEGLALCVGDALADVDAVGLLAGDAVVLAPQLVSGVALFFFCLPDVLALAPELELEAAGAGLLALTVVPGLTPVLVLVLTSGLVLLEVGGLAVLDDGVTVGLAGGDVLGLVDLVDLAEGAEDGEHDAVASGPTCPEDPTPSAAPPP
jgi:hypothetical protein